MILTSIVDALASASLAWALTPTFAAGGGGDDDLCVDALTTTPTLASTLAATFAFAAASAAAADLRVDTFSATKTTRALAPAFPVPITTCCSSCCYLCVDTLTPSWTFDDTNCSRCFTFAFTIRYIHNLVVALGLALTFAFTPASVSASSAINLVLVLVFVFAGNAAFLFYVKTFASTFLFLLRSCSGCVIVKNER